ncbi:sigma-70 family RNA polymerase sigma factor [Flavobacteriaceae bacterium]|nr:sigma-70 family RNA polymerase sigma factor [Flavobacteriaceae bacterium]
MTKLTTDEIVTMCQKLARKYRRPHINDDLISEGVLAVYERLEVKPEEYPASLYRRANKAMYDYINIRAKAVTIPLTRSAEALSKGVEYSGQTHSKDGLKTLADALSSTSEGFNDNLSLTVDDCTKQYEDKDFVEKAMVGLSTIEKEVIKLRYFDDKSQEDCAEKLGVSQKTVSRWETFALDKMAKCNK